MQAPKENQQNCGIGGNKRLSPPVHAVDHQRSYHVQGSNQFSCPARLPQINLPVLLASATATPVADGPNYGGMKWSLFQQGNVGPLPHPLTVDSIPTGSRLYLVSRLLQVNGNTNAPSKTPKPGNKGWAMPLFEHAKTICVQQPPVGVPLKRDRQNC